MAGQESMDVIIQTNGILTPLPAENTNGQPLANGYQEMNRESQGEIPPPQPSIS
jgi:hypothetical protein